MKANTSLNTVFKGKREWSLLIYIFFIDKEELAFPPSLQQPGAVVRRCFVEKVLFEILQDSRENTLCHGPFLIKLQGAGLQLYQKRLWHRCFSVNFVNFLKAHFFTENLRWLLLYNGL